jgi:excisionase family DNA binding protein
LGYSKLYSLKRGIIGGSGEEIGKKYFRCYNVEYFEHPTLSRNLMPQKEILTAIEVAKYLRIHPYTVKRLARTGKLPGFKVGGQWRFKKQDIEKLNKNSYQKRLEI